MVDTKTTDETAASALDGTELSRIVQGGNMRKATSKQFASLGAMTPFDRGTITTGTVTPEPSEGGMQIAVNAGAHTLAAPTTIGAYVLTYTNSGSPAAGAVTATGFDRVDDSAAVLSHTVAASVIECAVYNDGVSKRLIVTLIEDATL
jgi:hypothetical protein